MQNYDPPLTASPEQLARLELELELAIEGGGPLCSPTSWPGGRPHWVEGSDGRRLYTIHHSGLNRAQRRAMAARERRIRAAPRRLTHEGRVTAELAIYLQRLADEGRVTACLERLVETYRTAEPSA